jgi:hypothetical protein
MRRWSAARLLGTSGPPGATAARDAVLDPAALYWAIKDRDEWLARKAVSLGDAAEMRGVLEG